MSSQENLMNENCKTSEKYEMFENWLAMVDSTRDKEPACILCGVYSTGPVKFLETENVIKRLVEYKKKMPSNIAVNTYLNVFQTQHEISDGANCTCCACCHHWFLSRENRKFICMPIISLVWHMYTLQSSSKEGLDTRVLSRLCLTLSNKSNYYRSIFSEDELFLFEQVASSERVDINQIFTKWYYERNGRPIFLENSKLAEFVREHVKKKLKVDASEI